MAHIHERYDFTASAFIMHPTEPKILLLHHIKLNKWLQPGGHVELDENPLQALHHELQEETGLKPEDYEIIEPGNHPTPSASSITLPLPLLINDHAFNETHRHIDSCYLVQAKTDKITDNPDGAHDISWLSIQDIRNLQNKDMLFKDTLEICEWIFANKMQK